MYTSLPYTEYDKEHAVEKAAVQLLDYEKTGVLQPGESVTVEITADAQDMQAGTAHVTMRREQKETGSWMQETIILQSEMVLMRQSTTCWQHRV